MRIASVGPFARRFLKQHAIARVSAVFARSFHLETERDALCIVDALLGDGALNAVLAAPFAGLPTIPVGAKARMDNGVIMIADVVAFDAREAIDWRPAVVAITRDSERSDICCDHSVVIPRRGVAASPEPREWSKLHDGFRARAFSAPPRDAKRRRGNDGGKNSTHAAGDVLAALMHAALARAPADGVFRAAFDDAFDLSSAVERALRDRARLFMAWLAAPEDGSPPVAGLIGLGSGLTPAGDDFLGGAMIAARMIGSGERAEAVAASIAAQGPGATTILSGAMLRAAAEGFGGAALHALLAAVGRGDAGGAIRLIEGIDRIGHTSGWDALAGALAMLENADGRAP